MRTSFVLLVMFGLLTALPALSQDRQQRQNRQQTPFQFAFSVRGIDFSDDQQAKVEELRKKYTPQLMAVQRNQGSVFTAEQRRARQEVLRAARDIGKSREEALEAADAAAKLSDEQRKRLVTIQKEQSDLVAKIQGEVRALLTDDQQAQLRRQASRNAGGRPPVSPTHRDLKYGPHRRNVMDVWLASRIIRHPCWCPFTAAGSVAVTRASAEAS